MKLERNIKIMHETSTLKHETCLKHEHHVRNINITLKRGGGQSNSYTLSIVKREVTLWCLVLNRGSLRPTKGNYCRWLGDVCVCVFLCIHVCVGKRCKVRTHTCNFTHQLGTSSDKWGLHRCPHLFDPGFIISKVLVVCLLLKMRCPHLSGSGFARVWVECVMC